MLFYVRVLLKVSLGWIFAYWIICLKKLFIYLNWAITFILFFPILVKLFLNQGLCKLTHMQSDCPGTALTQGPVVSHCGAWVHPGFKSPWATACLFSGNFLKKSGSIGTTFLYATVFRGKERCSDLAHTQCCAILLKYLLPVGKRKFKQFWCFNCVHCHTHTYQYHFLFIVK